MAPRKRTGPASPPTGRPLPAAGAAPPRTARMLEKTGRRVLIPLLLLLFAVQAITSVTTKSATWDETNYFGMGDYLLRHWRWDVPSAVIHPPLAYYLDSLPVLFAPVDRSVWTYTPEARAKAGFLGAADIDRGQALLSSPANAGDRLLTLSRVMAILQSLLLGYFVYRFGAALYGRWAGILALGLFVLCPNMIAHGSLITPDMTLAVFFFITIYYFRMALVDDRPTHYVLAGLALGLALLSKFPALLLLPIEVIVLAALALGGRRIPVRWVAISWGCALLVLLIGYGFHVRPYLQGITIQQSHGPEGHWAFLMGELSRDGWWYYCLVAFVLKTPIPLLLLLAVASALLCSKAVRRAITVDDLVLWIPIAAVFAFFSVELRSIGLRYVLPVYPFAFVLASSAVFQVRRFRYLLFLPLLWYPVASAAIWPDYLAYFNEFAGGADGGYRYLVDSNLDWGQDLKGLKRFMDDHGIDRIYLSYFGTDSPARYGIQYDWLPSYELKNPDPSRTTIDLERRRYLAISVTNLQGVYMEPKTMFRWLDRYSPVAKIGHSIFVYYLE
jgi:4-amino-4-deoxy-L-arabinose transferase-like glycosyltransferase